MNTHSLKIYVIIGVVVFVLITTLIIGDRMMKSELDKDIKKLFADSKNISGNPVAESYPCSIKCVGITN